MLGNKINARETDRKETSRKINIFILYNNNIFSINLIKLSNTNKTQ